MRSTSVLALLFLGLISLGQGTTPNSADVSSSESSATGPLLDNARRQKPAVDEPARSIRVNTDMTLVPVTVMDAYGRNVGS